MRRAIASIVLAGCILCAPHALAATPTTRPDLGAPWTVDKIVAALAWRESVLHHASFLFTEDEWFVKGGVPVKKTQTDSFDLRYRGASFWRRHVTNPDIIVSADDSRAIDEICSWDQHINRTFLRVKMGSGDVELRGSIGQSRPKEWENPFLDALGLGFAVTDLTDSEWIQAALRIPGTAADISEETKDGQRRVNLTLIPGDRPNHVAEFTFLPDQDFVRLARILRITQRDDTPDHVDEYRADRIAQFDGFCMPAAVTAMPGGIESAVQYQCKLDSLSLRPPTDAEMEVRFPAGTQVVDWVQQQRSMIQATGPPQDLPFLKPQPQPAGMPAPLPGDAVVRDELSSWTLAKPFLAAASAIAAGAAVLLIGRLARRRR